MRLVPRWRIIHLRVLLLITILVVVLAVRVFDAFVLTPKNVGRLHEAMRLPVGLPHINPPDEIAFHGDMLLVASHDMGQYVRLSTGETYTIDLTYAGGYLQTVFFSDERPLGAFLGDRGPLSLLDMKTGVVTARFDTSRVEERHQWDISPDGQRLAVQTGPHTLEIYTVDSEWLTAIVIPDSYRMHWTVPTFSPDGERLATVLIRLDDTNQQDLFLWNAHTGALIQRLDGARETRLIHDLAFSPNGQIIVSGGSGLREDRLNGAFQVWEVPSGVITGTWHSGNISIHTLRFLPDGSRLAAVGPSHVWLWDTTQSPPKPGTELLLLETPNRRYETYTDIAFNPDGTLLAVASDNGLLYLYDAMSAELVRTFRAHEQRVSRVLFSDDGRLLVTLGGDYTARFWSIDGIMPFVVEDEFSTALPTPVMIPTVAKH